MNCYCSECNVEKDHAKPEPCLPKPSPEMLPLGRERMYVRVTGAAQETGTQLLTTWVVEFALEKLSQRSPLNDAVEMAEEYFKSVYPYCKAPVTISKAELVKMR